jgi:hypothetical protein
MNSILELSDNNSGNTAQLRLYSVSDTRYIDLDPTTTGVDFIETNARNASLVPSRDLFSVLNSSARDYVYEVHLSLKFPPSMGEVAICKMAGLFASYDGAPLPLPAPGSPPRADLILNTVRITTDPKEVNSTLITSSYPIPDYISFLSIGSVTSDINISLPNLTADKIGKQIFIKDSKKSSGSHKIIINGVIDGMSYMEITPPNYGVTLIYDGTQWCSI